MNGVVALIDEDAVARAWASTVLKTSAQPTLAFGTAADFFASLTLPGPACLLVDGHLQDMTCPQVAAECQRRGLRTALLFIVGRHQVELAVALMKGGAADVLVKPLDADELRRRVHAVLSASVRTQSHAQLARERLGRLTQRELEVVMLATNGLSNKDIADHLRISFRTVEVHRRNAMRKTGSANVVELTHFVGSAWRDERVAETAQRFELLSRREREVVQLGTDGLTNKAIASRLAISARTVESHRTNAQRKFEGTADQPLAEAEGVQLSLWSTGEPVSAVQRSEKRRDSLP